MKRVCKNCDYWLPILPDEDYRGLCGHSLKIVKGEVKCNQTVPDFRCSEYEKYIGTPNIPRTEVFYRNMFKDMIEPLTETIENIYCSVWEVMALMLWMRNNRSKKYYSFSVEKFRDFKERG